MKPEQGVDKATLATILSAVGTAANQAFTVTFAPSQVEVGNVVTLLRTLQNSSGGEIASADITAGTIQINRIRGAVESTILAATPATKADGQVSYGYTFGAGDWQLGDIYRIIFDGQEDTSSTPTIVFPPSSFYGFIVEYIDIQSDVASILVDTGTTLPATLSTIEGKIDTVDGVVDAVLVDTADMQPKLGTPAVDLSADIAAIKAETAAILADTGTTLDGKINTIDSNVDAILVDTGTTLPGTLGTPVGASISVDIAAIKAVVDSILVDTGTTLDSVVDAILVDTADMQPKLGTPAGASISADLVAIQSTVDSILTDTGTTLDGKINTIDNEIAVIDNFTEHLPVGSWTKVSGTVSVVSTGFGTTVFTTNTGGNIYEYGTLGILMPSSVPGTLLITLNMDDSGGTVRTFFQTTVTVVADQWYFFGGWDGADDRASLPRISDKDIQLGLKWSTGGPANVYYEYYWRRIS